MGTSEAVERLEREEKISCVFEMDADTARAVFDEEASVGTTSGMPLENAALRECMSRSVHLCIFCTDAFEAPTDHVMIMKDSDDRIVGFDVPHGREEEFRAKDGLLWLSDDFAMDPDAFNGEIRIVMLPQKVLIIGDPQGVISPVMLYPSTSVDIMLKKRYGMDLDIPMSSAIISFDTTR